MTTEVTSIDNTRTLAVKVACYLTNQPAGGINYSRKDEADVVRALWSSARQIDFVTRSVNMAGVTRQENACLNRLSKDEQDTVLSGISHKWNLLRVLGAG